jgi:hypothetical protein
VSKLFLKAEPGAILANDTLVNLVRGWPALTEKTVAGIQSSRKIRRTRSGGPSPAGWGRWADRGHAGPRWRGVVQLTRRSRRRVDRGTLQGESAIVPGFALLTPHPKGWRVVAFSAGGDGGRRPPELSGACPGALLFGFVRAWACATALVIPTAETARKVHARNHAHGSGDPLPRRSGHLLRHKVPYRPTWTRPT